MGWIIGMGRYLGSSFHKLEKIILLMILIAVLIYIMISVW